MKVLTVFIAIVLMISSARGADIAIALTDDRIAVDTGFSGARLTLFGSVTGIPHSADAIDIVSVLRGPPTTFQLRRYEKRGLIWRPGKAQLIEGAPGLFITSATRPIEDITPLPDQAAYGLAPIYLPFSLRAAEQSSTSSSEIETLKTAFISQIEKQNLYAHAAGAVNFKKSGLFSIDVMLPANTPVGDYDVKVYLYRDGELLDADEATLTVNKVGIERRIYEFAYSQSLSYGVFCVAVSLLAGWIAALAFRR